jgi:hypothetical protein
MINLTREEAQQILDALKTLHAKLSEPEPEPVAWIFVNKFDGGEYIFKHSGEGLFNKDEFDIKPLYTAPPQREWVGLTDEEVKDIVFVERSWADAVRKVEAKLKKKNI